MTKSLRWRELAPPAKIYLLIIYAAALPATWACFAAYSGNYSRYWFLLTLASLFVASVNIRLPKSTSVVISMGDVFTILALMYFGVGPALVTYWIDVTTATITDRVRQDGSRFYQQLLLHRFFFNLASCALSTLAMGAVWMATRNSGVSSPANVAVGLMLVAASWFLSNTLALAGAVAYWTNQRFLAVWKDSISLYLLNFFGSAAFAGFIALFYSRIDIYLILFAVPVALLLYRLYRYHSDQYEQAQQHIGKLNELYQEAIRTQEARQRSEERYRSLVEAASDAIFSLSREHRITSLNSAFHEITGWTCEEWMDRSFYDLIHADDRSAAVEILERVFAGETLLLPEMRLLRKSGAFVVVECTTTPQMQDGQVIGLLGIARDMTERKGLEETLRQSQKMEAVGRLAGGVAHDFNNLLVIIIGYSTLLLETLDLPEKPRSELTEIMKAGERAASLTSQLLTFSRKQIMQPVVLDLNGIVMNMHKMLRRLIGEDIELVNSLEPSLGAVKADAGQMEQIILNLAVNSRDAMVMGGRLTIETRNVSQATASKAIQGDARPGEYVMLAVSDTGSGIPQEIQSHIFEPFFTTKEEGKGTGLGLPTVYGIVNQSGGYIAVDSTVGHGARFMVFLPCIVEAEKAPPPQLVTQRPKAFGETVLLVEDEEAVRHLASAILTSNGYRVLEAQGGEEAIGVCRDFSGPIHALVTDVVMPQISGRQLAENIVTMRPDIRVLYMSGYTDDVISHHGVLEPGTAFLQKPFTPDTFAAKIGELLRL